MRNLAVVLVGCLVLSVAVVGQDVTTKPLDPVSLLPAAVGVPLKTQFMASPGSTIHLQQIGGSGAFALRAADPDPAAIASGGVLRITLDEAQQRAAGAGRSTRASRGTSGRSREAAPVGRGGTLLPEPRLAV